MKISTSRLFEQSTAMITRATRDLAETQAQLGTGRKSVFPSQDPTGAVPLLRLDGLVRRHEGHAANLDVLREKLGARETALQSTANVMLRIHELSIQAGNDTLNGDQRQHIAVEVRELRDQLLSLANTRDASGQPVFAGAGSAAAPYQRNADGQVQYLGDETALRAPVGEDRVLMVDAGGSSVFRPVQRDGQPVPFFDALDQLVTALQSNDAAAIRRGVGETDALRKPVILALADTGYQRGAIEAQSDLVGEQLVQLQALVSDRRDLDYAEAASRMQQQLLALEAAQASLARIGQLSLFDHLR